MLLIKVLIIKKKTNFCIYSILKSTSYNNKQTTKTIVEFYTKTSFKEKGALIFIKLSQKHDADIVLGIPKAKKTEYEHSS